MQRDADAAPPIPKFFLRPTRSHQQEVGTSTTSTAEPSVPPTPPVSATATTTIAPTPTVSDAPIPPVSVSTTTSVPAATIPTVSAVPTPQISTAQTTPVSAAPIPPVFVATTSTATASTSTTTPDITSLFFKVNKLETEKLQLTAEVNTLKTELADQKKLYDADMKDIRSILTILINDVKKLDARLKAQGGDRSGLGCKEDELQRKSRDDEHDDSDAARDKNVEPMNQSEAANIQEPGNAGAGASTSEASKDKGKAPVTQQHEDEAAAVTLAELFQQAGPSGSGINKYIYISSDSDSSSSEGSPDPTWRLFSHLDKFDCINAYHTHYEDKFATEALLELRQAQQQNENESIVINSDSDSDSDYYPKSD